MSRTENLASRTILTMAIFFTLFPIVWIGVNSLKYPRDILSARLLFQPTLNNYVAVLFGRGSDIPRYFLNSLAIAGSSTFLSIVIASLSAFGFSRFEFPGNLDKYVLGFLLFLRMLFPIALAIPFYVLTRELKIGDTIFAVVMAHTAVNIPFAVWMLKAFFDSVPQSIEEAARIDGCSWTQVLLRITLPATAPGVAASGIFVFILSWNDYLFPAVLTSSKAMTLPVGLANYVQENIVAWGRMAAGATLYMVPVFVFTLLIQNHLVKGFTMGGIGK